MLIEVGQAGNASLLHPVQGHLANVADQPQTGSGQRDGGLWHISLTIRATTSLDHMAR